MYRWAGSLCSREHDEVNFALKICDIHVRDKEFKIPRRRRCWIRFTGAARVKQKVLGSGLGSGYRTLINHGDNDENWCGSVFGNFHKFRPISACTGTQRRGFRVEGFLCDTTPDHWGSSVETKYQEVSSCCLPWMIAYQRSCLWFLTSCWENQCEWTLLPWKPI